MISYYALKFSLKQKLLIIRKALQLIDKTLGHHNQNETILIIKMKPGLPEPEPLDREIFVKLNNTM